MAAALGVTGVIGVVTGGGGVAPTVNEIGDVVVPFEPSGFVSVTVTDVAPTARAAVGVQLHVPPLATVAVQMVFPVASLTVTGSDGCPDPENAGVWLAVVDPDAGEVRVALFPIVTVTDGPACCVPPLTVSVTVKVTEPVGNGLVGVQVNPLVESVLTVV